MGFIALTACERVVMEAVWAADRDISLIEIMDILEKKFSKNWKRQTIATFLTHLAEKGYVESYRLGRVFYYRAIIDEKDFKDDDAQIFVDSWYSGSADVFLSALHHKRGLSDEERENILKLLDNME